MKRMKKFLALLVTLCLVVSLAACGKKGTEEKSQTDNNATQEETKTGEDTEKPQDDADAGKDDAGESNTDTGNEEGTAEDPFAKYEAVDLGGRTITVGVNWDYVPANTDYVINPETDDAGIEWALNNMKRIEAKYNCKIQYVNIPYDQRMEKITSSVMAESPVADIMGLDIAQILPLAANDMILAYDDIVPEKNDLFNEQLYVAPQGTVLGKTYAMERQGLPVTGDYLGVNMDIVDALGLSETPVELYEKGEWTWDKFMEIAKAATKDTDGDGKVDQFGVAGPPSVVMNMLVASNGGTYFDEMNNKQMLDSKETMQAFEQFNTIYNVDKVAYISNNITDWDANLNSFKEGNSAMFCMADWVMPDGDARPEYNYTVVPFPQGPANTTTASFTKAMAGYVILKGVTDPQYVYQVYEELVAPKDFDFEERDQGSRDWLANKFRTEEDIERTFKICGEGAKYEAANGVPGYPIGEILGAMVDEGQTPAQAVEAYKQIAQDKIDAIMNQE